MAKHILVISQCFYPEQFRINDICTEWVKRGYKVTAVTGIPNYPQGRFYTGYGLFKKRREVYNDIEIIRIPLIPRGRNVFMLSLNYLSFVVSGFFWKSFTKLKPDYVFNFNTSPMTQALPAVWLAKRRKIPCYIYVQDLWPENVEIITGIKSKAVLGPIGKMVDRIYRGCTRIFTTSRSFVESIHKRGVPKHKIEYWPQYAEDFYKRCEKVSIPEIPRDDAFNVIFAGNIGQGQGLQVLAEAAAILKETEHRKIRFNIVGDGRYKHELLRLTESLEVYDYFNFIPRQPAEKIPIFLAACDAAFLSLADHPLFKMTIPAKLQTYMACGIATIASAAGEIEDIIEESDAGICSAPGDAEKLAKNILLMLEMSDEELKRQNANARKYYEANFDKSLLLDRMEKHFN